EAERVAGGGRHPLGEGAEEALVERVDVAAEPRALGPVALEAGALLDGIGELAEPVAELDAARVDLESLGPAGVVGAEAGERREPRGVPVQHDGAGQRGDGGLDL